jgi:hypothetical protein
MMHTVHLLRFLLITTLLSTLGCGKVSPGGDGADGGDGGGGDGAPPGKQTLTVTVEGGGAVVSDPPGIECPETCSFNFDEGIEVTLTTTANPDSGLARWDGDCSGLAATCTVTMDAGRAAAAIFDLHGSARWVDHISFDGQDFIEHDVVVDPQGNPIVASTVNDGDGSDLYIAKFDRMTGDPVWDVLVDTSSGEYYGGVAVDADGNVYAATTILGFDPITIDGQTFTPDLYGNIIVLRLAAATGDIEWVKQWGGGAQDRPHALAIAGNFLFVAAESSSSDANFDGIAVAASTGDGIIVKARIEDGVANRVKHIDGSIELNAIAVNDTRLAVAGYFTGAPAFDAGCGISSSGTNSPDGWVAQFAQGDLDCLWANDFGDLASDSSTSAHGVAAYPGGGWVVTGSFQGNVLFAESGSALQSRGSFDAFAARYAANGAHVWSFRYGDTGSDTATAVTTTPGGAVLFTGAFAGDITFGGFDLSGANDVYVTRMSPGDQPTHEWAVALGGDSTDRAEGIAVDGDEGVFVSAYFTGMTTVDGHTFTAADYDAWLAALVR